MGKNTETSEVDVIINGQRAYNSIKDLTKAMNEYKAIARSTEDNVVREKAIEQYRILKSQQQEFNDKLKESGGLWSKVGEGIKSFGAIAGIGLGIHEIVSEVISFGKESYAAFKEAEKNAKLLEVAVGVNGGLAGAFEELKIQSEELQKQSIFSDDDIQKAQTMGLQFGLTSKRVKDLIPVITDYASATRQDLGGAMEGVLRGIEGNGKALKLYGIDVDANASKAENLASIVSQLTSKFKGQAEVVAETVSGQDEVLKNFWDDQKEKVGGFLSSLTEGVKTIGAFILNGFKPLNDEAEKFGKNLDFDAEQIRNIGINLLTAQITMLQNTINNATTDTSKLKKQLDDLQNKKSTIILQGLSDDDLKNKIHSLNNIKYLLTDQSKELDRLLTEYERRSTERILEKELGKASPKDIKISKEKIIDKTKDEIRERNDLIKKGYEEDLKNLDIFQEQESNVLSEQHNKGLISDSDYEVQKLEIDKKYLVLKIFNLKQYKSDSIEIEQERQVQLSKLESQLTEDQNKQNKVRLESLKKTLTNAKEEYKFELEALQTLLLTGVTTTGESVEEMIAHIRKLYDQIGKKDSKELLNNITKLAQSVSSIWSSIAKMRENSSNAQLAREKKNADAEEKHLKFLLDKKIITQAQYDKKVEALQEKQDKAQRKVAHDVAVRNRNMGIFNATISTAEAVAGALSMKPWGPWNIPLSIAAGVAGLVEIEEIRNTPIPELGKGKRFTGIGKHPYSTKKIFEPSGQASIVEDGETLLSASTSQNNPIVDALLDASLNNNGRLNGSHPAVEQQFPQVNSRRISETASLLRQSYVSSFADGGGSLNGYGVRNKEGSTSSSEMAGLLRNVHDVLSDLRENGVEANLNYVKFNRDKKRLDSITGASN